eukprot:TRINITY_DN48654_c0_g1_i1.p1 TRINITY_DN48654_c0_g1~~TRINITY_DN48654_c0_g1_i1.p1  ORF type:complete len:1266 (+),score=210.54 TRINITY_DN48654_c0_g1_i1:94-3798(+)
MSLSRPFIRMVDGKWELQQDGVDLIQTVKAPMQVIAAAGMYRTGKSYFLNVLAGNVGERAIKGFGVGSTSESCTRGIDVLVTTNEAGGSLVLLDTEGLASMEQDESYDAQIFGLGLLLSSFFVLNSMGVIDEAAIDRLYLIAELSKYIIVSASEENGDSQQSSNTELSQHFPPFLWLLRDFVVEMTTNGTQISEGAYLEKALESRPGTQRRSAERNETRTAIRALFPSRRCVTLVRPAAEEADVRNAVNLPEQKLRPEFVSKMNSLRTEILNDTPAKCVYGQALDGPMLLSLASRYIAAMNSPGALPCIKSAWEGVVDERNRRAADTALSQATKELTEAAQRSPLIDGAEWATFALTTYDTALAAFEHDAVQGVQIVPVRENLRTQILTQVENQRAVLWNASRAAAEKISEKVGRTLPQPPVVADGLNAIEKCLEACENEARGPLADSAAMLFCKRAVLPWLQAAEAAAASDRAAVAQASQAKIHAAETKTKEVEADLAGEKQRSEALQTQLEQEQRRREEEGASWKERHQEVTQAHLESQAALKSLETKHAEVSAAHAAEQQRTESLQQQVEQEQRRREEEGASWKARHQEVTEAHLETQGALKASEAKNTELSASYAAEQQRCEALQSKVEQEQRRREDECASWKERHQEATQAHLETQAALKAAEADHAETKALLSSEKHRGEALTSQLDQERQRREQEISDWKDRHQATTQAHADTQAALKASETNLVESIAAHAAEKQRVEAMQSQLENEKQRREEDTQAWKDRHEEVSQAHREAQTALKLSDEKVAESKAAHASERQRCDSLQNQLDQERQRREEDSANWKERHQEAVQSHQETQVALRAADASLAEAKASHASEVQRSSTLQSQIEQEQRRREEEVSSLKELHEQAEQAAKRLLSDEREQFEKKLSSERAKRTEAEDKVSITERALRSSESSIENLQNEISEHKLARNSKEKQFEDLNNKLQAAEEATRIHRSEVDEQKAARSAAEQQAFAARKSLSDAEKVGDSLRIDLSRLKSAHSEMQAACEAEKENVRQAQVAAQTQRSQMAELEAALENARKAEAKARAAGEDAQDINETTRHAFEEACEEFMRVELASRDARIKELEGQMQNFGVLAGGAVGMGIGAVVGAFHHVATRVDKYLCKGGCIPQWNDQCMRFHSNTKKKHAKMLKERPMAWNADGIPMSARREKPSTGAQSSGQSEMKAASKVEVHMSEPLAADSAAGPVFSGQ